MGLSAACWACFMCHHKLWPTSVSHPLSSLNSFWGLVGGKYYQKITLSIFRLVLQNFALPGCFPDIIFQCYLFSLLSSGWVVIGVCNYFIPRTHLIIREIVNWCEIAISSYKSTYWMPSLCCSFLIPFLLKLIVASRLYDIYMRVDDYSNASKFNHALTFNPVGGYFNLFKYHHLGCQNNLIFSNLGSCAACWAWLMCHHELWPTTVSHPFFFFWLHSLYGFHWPHCPLSAKDH